MIERALGEYGLTQRIVPRDYDWTVAGGAFKLAA